MTRHRLGTALLVTVVVLAGCTASPGGAGGPDADFATPTTAPDDGPGDSETAGPSNGTATPAVDENASTNATAASANGTLSVHFLNVGQAASALIVGPGNETMLVDTGEFTDDGEHVIDYLERRNVSRIDHLVLTHAHADHVGGHAAVIDHFESERDGIGAAYDPGIAASTRTYEAYLDAVEEHDVTLYETREGDPIAFAGAEVQVLAPPEPYLASEDRNENSVALRISHGNASFLFTGDGEDALEEHLVENHSDDLGSTVLAAGHHGAADSNGPEFLDAIRPNIAVISSGYDSLYGHPHGETLDRFANRSIAAYWTATHGDVVVTTDGENLTVATQRAAPTDPNALRDGNRTDPATTDSVETRATFDLRGNGTAPPATATDGGTPAAGDTATATPTPEGTTTGTPEATATPTQARTATATPEGTATAGGGALAIETIHADAAGDDWENLNDEYVVFRNDGDDPLDLSGWTVEDESGATYTVPDGFTLDPGATVTLYTGGGTDSEAELYWESERPIWNNGGDTVIVTNAEGERVRTEEYS